MPQSVPELQCPDRAGAASRACRGLHDDARADTRHLPADVLRQMQATYAQPFDDVVVHRGARAHAMNLALGSLACTLGNHIYFRRGAYAPHTAAGRTLIAHELAHVVQKRRGRGMRADEPVRPADVAALELEADLGALAASRGARFECRLRDAALRPARWGCAGHFYSVYLAYLNAQASEKDAFKTALYCWLPDQVEELDAKHLFLDYQFRTALTAGSYARFPGATGVPLGVAQQIGSEREYYEMIHRGIHCLNGADAKKESALRAKVLQNGNLNFLLRGVAHHPFGDSYAHRDFENPKVMYGVGIGHGTDLGHPDEPWHQDRGPIFLDYIADLQVVASAWTKKAPIVPIGALQLALDPVLHSTCRTPPHAKGTLRKVYAQPLPGKVAPPGGPQRPAGSPQLMVPNSDKYYTKALEMSDCAGVGDERGCCDHLKRVAAELVGRPIRHPWYDPVREPQPWRDYYREHKPLIDANVQPGTTQEATIEQTLATIRSVARGWNLMPR